MIRELEQQAIGRGRTDLPVAWVGNSTQKIHFCVMYRPGEVSGSAASSLRWGGPSVSAVPPVALVADRGLPQPLRWTVCVR